MNISELLSSIVNTLAVCTICVFIAVPIGGGLSLLLQRTNLFGRRWAWLAIGSQLAVPLYVFAGGWSAGFGLQGWMRWSGGKLFGSELFAGWLFGTPLEVGAGSLLAVSAIHALAAIPWVCLIVSLGLVWAHRSQEEMAVLEGGTWHWLRFHVLTKLRIWLAASCLWCVIPVLTEMVVTNLYQVPTVAEQVYLDASRGSVSVWTYVAATTLCLLPIIVCGEYVRRRIPAWSDVIYSLAHHRGRERPLGRWRIIVSLGTWLIVALLVGWPMINLLIKAGWQPRSDAQGQTHYGWSSTRLLTTGQEALTQYVPELSWSALLAICSTTLALSTAATLSLWLTSNGTRTVVSVIALLMIAVPGPLVGMMIIALLNRSSPAWLGILYDTTLAAPTLAQQFRLFPLAWLLSQSIHRSISDRVWQQATLEGLSRAQFVIRVLWPQTWKLWITSALILAVVSIGELSCSILVLPPGVTTLSMRLFEMLHFGMRHQDSGLCGLLIVFGWLVSLISWKTLTER